MKPSRPREKEQPSLEKATGQSVPPGKSWISIKQEGWGNTTTLRMEFHAQRCLPFSIQCWCWGPSLILLLLQTTCYFININKCEVLIKFKILKYYFDVFKYDSSYTVLCISWTFNRRSMSFSTLEHFFLFLSIFPILYFWNCYQMNSGISRFSLHFSIFLLNFSSEF